MSYAAGSPTASAPSYAAPRWAPRPLPDLRLCTTHQSSAGMRPPPPRNLVAGPAQAQGPPQAHSLEASQGGPRLAPQAFPYSSLPQIPCGVALGLRWSEPPGGRLLSPLRVRKWKLGGQMAGSGQPGPKTRAPNCTPAWSPQLSAGSPSHKPQVLRSGLITGFLLARLWHCISQPWSLAVTAPRAHPTCMSRAHECLKHYRTCLIHGYQLPRLEPNFRSLH